MSRKITLRRAAILMGMTSTCWGVGAMRLMNSVARQGCGHLAQWGVFVGVACAAVAVAWMDCEVNGGGR